MSRFAWSRWIVLAVLCATSDQARAAGSTGEVQVQRPTDKEKDKDKDKDKDKSKEQEQKPQTERPKPPPTPAPPVRPAAKVPERDQAKPDERPDAGARAREAQADAERVRAERERGRFANENRTVVLRKLALEEEKHRDRVARIMRLRELSLEKGQRERVTAMDDLLQKERDRYRRWKAGLTASLDKESLDAAEAKLARGRGHGERGKDEGQDKEKDKDKDKEKPRKP